MRNQQKSFMELLQSCCKKWQIETKDKDSHCITSIFVFSASFSGFDGHFPGKPVLPAIIQLAAVRYIAERGLGQAVRLGGYSRTKFREIIQPDEKKRLTLINSFSN